jgi:hypothetical protein
MKRTLYQEKYSGIVMPRLKKGYPPTVMQKINTELRERQLIEGLYIGANYPYAQGSCGGAAWSVIPYQFLKPYLSPETKFKFPEK